MVAEPLQDERPLAQQRGNVVQAERTEDVEGTEGVERAEGFAGRPPWTLMYHSVDSDEQDPYLLTVSPERFARQMDWLHRRKLRGVAMSELLRAHAEGAAAGLVGLTFDDGYADFPREVVPVLRRHGFTATAYVVAGRMGGHNAWDADAPRKPLVTIAQVRAMASAGVEIGSHSLSHRRMKGLPAEELALETRRSKELLESVVEAPVAGFCYPYGLFDDAAIGAVREAGYGYGVGIGHHAGTSRWALPRCYVGQRDGGLRLRAKRVRHAVRGIGW
ncbi:polysaccharide deacetylase family protein [Streptacidiphilus sp. MAP5-3]|uniref:polysaccharide deacetylase family protein n=1 Tax=unclassified Streptacidiphilus TaxID=2643834 RepID=UPI0035169304